ncbi:MAG: beta-galactosidase [Acidobacteriaceae bacterium]|nr:beta-galactosidase [Acidobacteriaceae bacterium]
MSFPCVMMSQQPIAPAGSVMPNVLYGAAYYDEYMPSDLQPDRLDKDVALMKQAGISVVRMGESTWSLWEPSDGQFDYAWMDRIVDAMGKANIKVIMGTPTYSIPVWMWKAHPEMLARPLGGAAVGYGMRQNMNTDDPNYRRYAERLIINLVNHYKANPAVIGWQIDNETGSYGASNPQVFDEFVARLKKKFVTTDALNKAWFLNYWGQDVSDWSEMPTRDNATSTSYKLEWSRFEQDRVTNFLAWQAGLVREHRRPDQFVTQDFASVMRQDVNEPEVAKVLDVVACNPYHGEQDHLDGVYQALQGDYFRSLKRQNYLVTETNAQSRGWDSAGQYPPYDGQLRLDVYTDISSGANMVEYWHWHSIHAGQETYWKGVLSHDLEPNRAYAEVSRIAHELQKIGPQLVNMKIRNDVAILYSADSSNGISFMPYTHGGGGYSASVQQLHNALYKANVGADFVFPSTADFSPYKLLIVPSLYVADDALLKRISEYVRNGGHVLMTFKSGFTNENSAVRWEKAPGPLAEAAGFTYQEFSNLERPLALRGDPFHVGEENRVSQWAEFLQPTTAKPLATYDHPFFGRWPAITENQFGKGTLLYEGTALTDGLQQAIVQHALQVSGIAFDPEAFHSAVRVKRGVNAQGKSLTYLLNYSSNPAQAKYDGPAAHDVLTGKPVLPGQRISIPPWDLVIAESDGKASELPR